MVPRGSQWRFKESQERFAGLMVYQEITERDPGAHMNVPGMFWVLRVLQKGSSRPQVRFKGISMAFRRR